MTILLYGFVRPLTYLLQVPAETVEDMVTYLIYVFAGFFAIFLYNYFASVLRSIGNSVLPLVFLGISVALNIGLDLLFVVTFSFGIAGAAVATVISQYIAGIGLMLYFLFRYSDLCPAKKDSFFVRIYVFAAVRYELWHPDDTGISQFFWYNDYGSVFRGGQN